MEHNAFTAGIEPGGLNLEYEVRILVCFMLQKAGRPLDFAQINEALLKRGLVNYFELAAAVNDLKTHGHIVQDSDGSYQLMPSGIALANELGGNLPLSVREKALDSLNRLFEEQRTKSENHASYERVGDGYIVNLIVSDIGSDLLNLSLFMPTEKDARATAEQFMKDPLAVYQKILGIFAEYNGE